MLVGLLSSMSFTFILFEFELSSCMFRGHCDSMVSVHFQLLESFYFFEDGGCFDSMVSVHFQLLESFYFFEDGGCFDSMVSVHFQLLESFYFFEDGGCFDSLQFFHVFWSFPNCIFLCYVGSIFSVVGSYNPFW